MGGDFVPLQILHCEIGCKTKVWQSVLKKAAAENVFPGENRAVCWKFLQFPGFAPNGIWVQKGYRVKGGLAPEANCNS
jgi:hypothetical protein